MKSGRITRNDPSALVASGMRIVFQCVVLRLRGDGLNGNGDGVRLGDG